MFTKLNVNKNVHKVCEHCLFSAMSRSWKTRKNWGAIGTSHRAGRNDNQMQCRILNGTLEQQQRQGTLLEKTGKIWMESWIWLIMSIWISCFWYYIMFIHDFNIWECICEEYMEATILRFFYESKVVQSKKLNTKLLV